MQKNAKIGLILGIGAAVAALSYYFLIYKPSKANGGATTTNPPAPTSNGGNTGTSTSPAQTLIGKHVYAKQTPVYEVYSNGQTKRTINKDGWVGLVYEEVTLSGNPFYRVGTNTYVAKSLVYAK